MPKYCVPRKFETEEQQSLDEGSEKQNDWRSLLFELSPTVRTFWAEKYNCYINPNGKYQTLLGFTDMRERFLQASHESSMELLYCTGWKPMDTMCAYLLGMTTNRMYNLSPDAVRAAVRMDWESAVRLLDKKVLGEVIVHHHSSYQTEWQRIWMEFLYLFCDFDDRTFLHTEHKTKKLRQQCQVICERLANPDYEQMELEKELRACALLPVQEELDDVSDKKFIKKQKAALLRAFVSSYLWRCSDWKNMKEHPAGRAMARNLLWGYYRNGELQTAFALKENGSVLDGKGETVSPESFADETGKIGLVHPEELTETERKFWKKYAGKEKWKQPFPQLKIPACHGQYALSTFTGIQVTQLFLITATGKWGLYQGSDKNQYMSYHMADLLHGYGAQLIFDDEVKAYRSKVDEWISVFSKQNYAHMQMIEDDIIKVRKAMKFKGVIENIGKVCATSGVIAMALTPFLPPAGVVSAIVTFVGLPTVFLIQQSIICGLRLGYMADKKGWFNAWEDGTVKGYFFRTLSPCYLLPEFPYAESFLITSLATSSSLCDFVLLIDI